MSESFESVMDFARKISNCEFGEHPNDLIREWCEIHDCGTCTVCLKRLLDRLKRAHEHEIEQLRKTEYHRGYEDGQRSMDAGHRAVAMRLRGLRFDGGSHENLNKIAYGIYPCATGWTVESCEGLRDKIIELLGGVHDGVPDNVSCCACGDDSDNRDGQSEAVDVDGAIPDGGSDVPAAGGVGDLAVAQVAYDELGNERHKAVCRLREWEPDKAFDNDRCGEVQIRLLYQILDLGGAMMMNGADAAASVRDRLIHLLGGDEPNFTKIAETIKSSDECEDKLMENGENHKIATVSDLIEERDELERKYMSAFSEKNMLHAECEFLRGKCRELHAKLEEADAAIANWREREKSFAESERLRDELQKMLDETREQREHWASEATKMYRLFFSHDKYCMPNSPSEMVADAVGTLQEKYDGARGAIRHLTGQWSKAVKQRKKLQAKLDTIREAIDE